MSLKVISPYFFFSLILVFQISCSNQNQTKTDSSDKVQKPFAIEKGVNISHWLSQSKKRGIERAVYFTEEDMRFIDSVGYDHIRLPIDEEQMWDDAGNKIPEAFNLMQNAIEWAQKYGLKVIVDLHIIRSHHFNHNERPLWTSQAEREKFIDLWRQLSGELKKYPAELVAYEYMNEAVADDPEEWNDLVAKVHSVIRDLEPERKVFIGSNRWQSVNTFDDLKVPENDPNIILSFHFYIPFAFTHHQASWTGIKDYTGPVRYPGKTIEKQDLAKFSKDVQEDLEHHVKIYTKDSLAALIQKPIDIAEKLNLQLYCGEFGCLPTVPREDRMQWYKDMREILESNNIAWTHWDYKGGFGVRKQDGSNIDWEFIDVLLK